MGELICGLQEEQVEQLTAEKLATEQCAAEQDAAGAYGGECGAAACAGRRGGGGRAAGCLVGVGEGADACAAGRDQSGSDGIWKSDVVVTRSWEVIAASLTLHYSPGQISAPSPHSSLANRAPARILSDAPSVHNRPI